MNDKDLFRGRRLIIATRHKKEEAIAPELENRLGVTCIVPENFNTNMLGTFSGEVTRVDDPAVTVRKKCLWAMDTFSINLDVASEGSFSPHPSCFFVPPDKEIVIFIDKVKFPSHGLITRKAKNDTQNLIKGITMLTNHFHQFQSSYSRAFIETDMLAMYNPTRMSVIMQSGNRK